MRIQAKLILCSRHFVYTHSIIFGEVGAPAELCDYEHVYAARARGMLPLGKPSS
jgi:hypothetical protein